MKRFARGLVTDERGANAVEFAIVSPVLFILVMGLGDLAFQGYAQAVLTGAVQKAARDDTLQQNGSATDPMDQAVENAVAAVVRKPIFNKRANRRVSFDNYAQLAGEPFVDSVSPSTSNVTWTYDGICNHGEAFTDLNGNGTWDANIGQTGQGGASDTTRYTVTVTYNRLFPIARLIGWPSTVTLSATTILRNQPYLKQTTYTYDSKNNGTCP